MANGSILDYTEEDKLHMREMQAMLQPAGLGGLGGSEWPPRLPETF